MNETFNLRSFVENQVEKFSTPRNLLVDRFRQTVESIKFPFLSMSIIEGNSSLFVPSKVVSFNLSPSESAMSDSSPNSISVSQSTTQNFQTLAERFSRQHSPLRRHVSELNTPNHTRPIYHDNPPVDVHMLLNSPKPPNRSRSLIRQSTDTTCTFPIRRPLRRMESIEIPGLNGVKSIRYINDNLGKLEPNLYRNQAVPRDHSYNSGQLTFTLFYNQSLASLIITIVSIDHLPYRDANCKVLPNPFVKITILPDRRKKFQTKVSKHTQSTQLNETFQYPISYEQLCKRLLLFSVYDFRRSSKRNLIGTVKIEEIYSIADITSRDVVMTKNIVPGTEVSSTRQSHERERDVFPSSLHRLRK